MSGREYWMRQVEAGAVEGSDGRAPTPRWLPEGAPACSEDECPQYDGKRCRLMGFRPSTLCEPVVREMAKLLRAVKP